jgi:hypothetical protein
MTVGEEGKKGERRREEIERWKGRREITGRLY